MRTSNVGRGTDLSKSFDWGRHHGMTRQHLRGMGMDAAGVGNSGMTFLQSALELIEPKLVEPLQSITHERDLPIKVGGGFPEQLTAWASNYASSGGGTFGLQGTVNTDISIAQADVTKGVWPTFNWAQGFTISYIDLERMVFAKKNGNQPPFTLQQLYENSVRTTWRKALDMVAYFGYLGNPGLVNNTSAPAYVVPSGGTGTTWATKTPAQILADINFGLNATVKNSGFDAQKGMADTLLLPYTQFAALTQPMNTAANISILQYVRENCVSAQAFGNKERFKIYSLPDPWISGQGIGNTNAVGVQGNGLDRAIFYRKDEDNLMLKLPTVMTPAMTIPTERGPGYSTFFVGCIGAVMFLRSTTMAYADGI